jgi:hypothetical protein
MLKHLAPYLLKTDADAVPAMEVHKVQVPTTTVEGAV